MTGGDGGVAVAPRTEKGIGLERRPGIRGAETALEARARAARPPDFARAILDSDRVIEC